MEEGLILNIKIGIVKELFKNSLITDEQMNKLIKIFKNDYTNKLKSMQGKEPYT